MKNEPEVWEVLRPPAYGYQALERRRTSIAH